MTASDVRHIYCEFSVGWFRLSKDATRLQYGLSGYRQMTLLPQRETHVHTRSSPDLFCEEWPVGGDGKRAPNKNPCDRYASHDVNVVGSLTTPTHHYRESDEIQIVNHFLLKQT